LLRNDLILLIIGSLKNRTSAGIEFVRQVDVLSRAVEISADGLAPEVRAAFSLRVAELKESFALGQFLPHTHRETATEFHRLSRRGRSVHAG
jgi:hypothetical protein